MANDPVCNMQVDERNAKYSTVFLGRTYYFCSAGCLAEFQRYPQDYVQDLPEQNGEKDV